MLKLAEINKHKIKIDKHHQFIMSYLTPYNSTRNSAIINSSHSASSPQIRSYTPTLRAL